MQKAFLLPTVFNSSATHVMRWAHKHLYEKFGSSNTENGTRILLQKIVERFTISTDECDSANIQSDYLLSESCFDEICRKWCHRYPGKGAAEL
jgi:hypothetical protein